jgi:hypothetical protein
MTIHRMDHVGIVVEDLATVARYEDSYRYCYVRGPDGVLIGLVEELR